MNSIILANDPSICGWGYAVIDCNTGKVLHASCIKTEAESKKRQIRKGDDSIRRINEINTRLLRIIRRYKVNYIISEQPHGSQSASAAVMIGMVTGMLQTISDCLGIGLEWYSEGDSKKHLLNKRSATKGETKEAIKRLYEVPWFDVQYKDEAVADAMSIYHLAKDTSPAIKMLVNEKDLI